MDRIEMIKAYKQRQDNAEQAKLRAMAQRKQECIDYIHSVKDRIDELVAVANTCLDNGITFSAGGHCSHYRYDQKCFMTNGISHILGFVTNTYYGGRIIGVGIYGGGACDYNLTVIDDVVDVSGPAELHVLERFVKEFDTFESKFYEFVDNTCRR